MGKCDTTRSASNTPIRDFFPPTSSRMSSQKSDMPKGSMAAYIADRNAGPSTAVARSIPQSSTVPIS